MRCTLGSLLLTFAAIVGPVSLLSADDPVSASSRVTDAAEVRGNRLAPKAFQAAVAKARPWIVKIETYGGVSPTGAAAKSLGWTPGNGPSTGIIVGEDGWVLTSTFHFLTRPQTITVSTSDGTRRVARLVGKDETRQLALLKMDGVKDLPTPTWHPRNELQVGQWAIAAGFGYGGNDPSLTAGIISALSRISTKAIQTDANLSPANYGGPLLDIEGNLIGICSALHPQATQAGAGAQWYDSGIGFAVPEDSLKRVLDRLKEGKNIESGAMGVQVTPEGDPPLGAHVRTVVPDSAAAKAGIKVGDEIAEVEGLTILDANHLTVVMGAYAAGDKVSILVVRGEEEIPLTIELSRRADITAALQQQQPMPPM